MDLTAVQRRTTEVLVRPPPEGLFAGDFVDELRGDLERRLAEIDPPGRTVLSKGRLNLHERCEGSFAADLAGEREAFAHRRGPTVGPTAHRAAQAGVAGERGAQPDGLLVQPLPRLLHDPTPALSSGGRAERERSG